MTTYAYNAAGQVTSRITRVDSSTSITETFAYDSRGNLTSYTDGDGYTTTYTYDIPAAA